MSDAEQADLPVSIAAGTPQLALSDYGVRGTLPLVIANTGATMMFYSICGTTLERSVAGEWHDVYFVACALGAKNDDLEIPPQSQRTVQFPVLGTIGVGVAEKWKRPVAGVYRLKVAVRTNRTMVVRVTEAFELGT